MCVSIPSFVTCKTEFLQIDVLKDVPGSGDVEMEAGAEVEKAVAVLKQAAATGTVPTAVVCKALVQLEKKKLAVSIPPGIP